MYPNLLQSSFFRIFLILYSINPASLLPIDSRYENCISNSRSSCGTSLRLAYPFWGNGRAQYCGHPGFELHCNGSYMTINIMSNKYNVLDISYNTSVLRIAREDFARGACPRRGSYLRNTTLDWTLFNYTSNVRNATLFYDCPADKLNTKAPFSFFCNGSYPNSLSYFVISKDWEHELDTKCGVKVYVPVYRDAIQYLADHPSNVGDVLKRGFEVKWVIDEGHCHECTTSGGGCGYNRTLGQSTCFCEKGASSTICPASSPRKGLSMEAKVGIGLGAAAIGLLIMITFIVFRGPLKELHSSSTLQASQKSPYHPSTEKFEEGNTYFGAHVFSYKELEQATNNFEPSRELGKGGFGTVYHGKLQDGRDVAIKRLYEKHSKQVAQFMNELEILTRLDHKHLVKLYGCTTRHSRDLLLVYEYVPNGTVADHLHGQRAKPGSLPWPTRLTIAIETASALVYLHSSDIIHRDVKTKNILLDVNYSVKVADFGLSRLFPLDASHVSTTPQGSPGYVDPEYHQNYHLTDKSDVYSFGVVLAELISAKPAVDRSRSRDEINLSSMAINKIKNHALHEFVDPSLEFESNSRVREEVTAMGELTFQCLQATREMRPSMEEVLASLVSIRRKDGDVTDTKFVGLSGVEESNQIYHDISVSLASGSNSQVSKVGNVSYDVF